jgi:hypothetical protein
VTWVAAAAAVALFLLLARSLRLAASTRQVLARARAATATMRDRTLPVEERERLVQAHARGMFVLAGWLLLGGALATMLPAALLLLLDAAGLQPVDPVVARLLDWRFVAALLSFALLLRWSRRR